MSSLEVRSSVAVGLYIFRICRQAEGQSGDLRYKLEETPVGIGIAAGLHPTDRNFGVNNSRVIIATWLPHVHCGLRSICIAFHLRYRNGLVNRLVT